MIDCVVVNNEENIELIQQFIVGYTFFNVLKFFTNSIDAARYIRRHKVDLLLLNTDLDNIDGFEYYQSFSEEIKVVYTSCKKDLAIKAFDVDAIDYLHYPFTERRFIQMLQKVKVIFTMKLNSKQNEERFIQIRSDYSTVNVDLREIEYVEAFGDYLKIHLVGKKPIITLMTLKSITDKLPETDFIRIHRSFIVNLKFVESVKGKRINIGVTELPLSKSFEKDFFKTYVKEII